MSETRSERRSCAPVPPAARGGCRWCWAFLLVLLPLFPAAEGVRRDYPIPGHGRLLLTVPEGWQVILVQPEGETPPTLFFHPHRGEQTFQLFVTVYWEPGYDQDRVDDAAVRALVERVGQEVLAMSDEDELAIVEFPGASGPGYLFQLSDEGAGPGEYPYVTQGAVAAGDLLLAFTLLHRERPAAEVESALAMLADARQQADRWGI